MTTRRNSLTPKLLKDLVKFVQRTSTIGMACALAGISESVFYKWQAIGRELIEDYEDVEDVPDEDQIYVELVESVERAKLLSCVPAIDTIQKAIKNGDVKAAQILLARRIPNEFGDFMRKEFVIKNEGGIDTGTGIAEIHTSGDTDIEELLLLQQQAAHNLASSQTGGK